MPSYSREVKIPGKSSQEIYSQVSAKVDRFFEKANIGKVEVTKNDGGKLVEFKSSMFSGTLTCIEGGFKLDAKLSLLAAPFRSKIDEGIDKWVAKSFT